MDDPPRQDWRRRPTESALSPITERPKLATKRKNQYHLRRREDGTDHPPEVRSPALCQCPGRRGLPSPEGISRGMHHRWEGWGRHMGEHGCTVPALHTHYSSIGRTKKKIEGSLCGPPFPIHLSQICLLFLSKKRISRNRKQSQKPATKNQSPPQSYRESWLCTDMLPTLPVPSASSLSACRDFL